mmetsp:Transcript_32961/g.60331  ORF Transcript_32961/g.60331 Transcript_32961/m.60331 type:complete len:515 (+) Transcript_32961:63-1607(+)
MSDRRRRSLRGHSGRVTAASAGILSTGWIAFTASQPEAFVPAARTTRRHVQPPLSRASTDAGQKSERSKLVKDSFPLAIGLAAGIAALAETQRTARDLSARSHIERPAWTNLQLLGEAASSGCHKGSWEADLEADARKMKVHAASLRAEVAMLEESLASDRLARLRAEFRHWLSASGSQLLHPAAFEKGAAEVAGLSMTEEEAAQLVGLHDADQDGSLCFAEFVNARSHLSDDLARLREPRREPEVVEEVDHADEAQSEEAEMPEEVIDTQPMVRILAMFAFLLPLADAFRTMAPMETEAVVGRAILDGMDILQPILMLSMSSLGCRWSLPQLLRFSVFQAFTMSMLLCIASIFVTPTGWLSLAGMGIGNVHTMEQLSSACLVLAVGAVGYSWISLSLGVLPDQLPVVSGAARAALGQIHKPNRSIPAAQPTGASPQVGNEDNSSGDSARDGSDFNGMVLHFFACLIVSLVYLLLLSSYWAVLASVLVRQSQSAHAHASLASEAWPYVMTIPLP